MLYVRYPLSLRNIEDLLFERGIDICHETARLWWNRFGPMFAGEIRKQRAFSSQNRIHFCGTRSVYPALYSKKERYAFTYV